MLKKHSPFRTSGLFLVLFLLLLSSCYQQRRLVNGMNNLKPDDWAGTYAGRLPCDGCPGIETRIVFNNDGTYTRASEELLRNKKPYTTTGKSWWDQDKGLIILQDSGYSITVPYRMNSKGLIMMHLGTGVRPREERPEYTLFKETGKNPTEHYWSLVELNSKTVENNMPDGKPHILFHGSTGKTDGSGGCNDFSGNFSLRSGNELVVSPLVSTRKGCPPGGVENEFLRTIEGTSTYEVKDDKMMLRRDGKVIARFEAVWMH